MLDQFSKVNLLNLSSLVLAFIHQKSANFSSFFVDKTSVENEGREIRDTFFPLIADSTFELFIKLNGLSLSKDYMI